MNRFRRALVVSVAAEKAMIPRRMLKAVIVVVARR